ncbi:hypothetical protein EG329_014232 [Mollisiaceae sp. DMI_Dod_QoI]|nr:hypothetical protein EG329_014232 [Helotiales sp. DMI_Dod_QoI]
MKKPTATATTKENAKEVVDGKRRQRRWGWVVGESQLAEGRDGERRASASRRSGGAQRAVAHNAPVRCSAAMSSADEAKRGCLIGRQKATSFELDNHNIARTRPKQQIILHAGGSHYDYGQLPLLALFPAVHFCFPWAHWGSGRSLKPPRRLAQFLLADNTSGSTSVTFCQSP